MQKTIRQMLTDGSLEEEIIRQAIAEDAEPEVLRGALKIVNDMKKALGIKTSAVKASGPATLKIVR